jgi:acetyl esterase/lipase
MTAVNRSMLHLSLTQRLLRASGVRNRLFPAAKLDRWAAHPRLPYTGQPPNRVLKKIDVARTDLGGRPVYQVSPRLVGDDVLTGHLLYLHGGAYVLDLLPQFHWPAIAKLANTVRRTMTVPIYPIAPEHSYREVFPFLLQVYRRMLETRDPSSIAFMGDSAGGGMAFALCHAVRDAGLPQPTDAVLLSPWMHIALPDPDNPLVSPCMGPLAGLPRLTVFTGTHDVLNPDARAFRRRATAEGLDIGWYELDGGVHAWMLLPGRRAANALAKIDQVLNR